MTVKTILTEPNKILRQVSVPVGKVGNEERQLMDDMLETMYAANGIGLAAIQIGVPKRIIVMDISKEENKKYFLSKKDIIFLESLRSDGIEIDKKYDNLYKIEPSEIPTDIQVMINNNEKGAALVRLAEVIGQDELDRIDEDTIYFIISTLNQLNIDVIRNKILLKVLPLKV